MGKICKMIGISYAKYAVGVYDIIATSEVLPRSFIILIFSESAGAIFETK